MPPDVIAPFSIVIASRRRGNLGGVPDCGACSDHKARNIGVRLLRCPSTDGLPRNDKRRVIVSLPLSLRAEDVVISVGYQIASSSLTSFGLPRNDTRGSLRSEAISGRERN